MGMRSGIITHKEIRAGRELMHRVRDSGGEGGALGQTTVRSLLAAR